MPRRPMTVDVSRTPIDTIDTALNDLERQNAALRKQLSVNEKLRSGLESVRTKALAAMDNSHIKLLPPDERPDTGTRNIGFLGAGLAARAAEVIEANGAPMHVKAIFAQMSLMPGLGGLSIESLRATMNSDCKRGRPRLVILGQGMYGIYGVHDGKGFKRRQLKAA
jgi:hypothetical protein